MKYHGQDFEDYLVVSNITENYGVWVCYDIFDVNARTGRRHGGYSVQLITRKRRIKTLPFPSKITYFSQNGRISNDVYKHHTCFQTNIIII